MTTRSFSAVARLIAVLTVLFALLAVSASAAPARVAGCPDDFVSGDTQFVYVLEGATCRVYLVYYTSWQNLGYDPESWATLDSAYPGWLVLQRNGDGGVILWGAGIERYVNPARGVDVSYPAPAG